LSRRPSENDRAGPTEPRWIPELLAAWLSDPEIAPALAGGWRPPMPARAATIEALAQAARQHDVAAADAARTFVRLVARGIADLLAPLSPRPAETRLAIGGRLGRWLAADLDELLPDVGLPDMRPLGTADMEFAPQAFDAAATAWWGQLYLDQTPGNLPSLTGARSPRVLGRLTPGSPQQFLRLTRHMAASQPVVSLRTAI
jgi:anhydro-N-acetylmuramic acid kinase